MRFKNIVITILTAISLMVLWASSASAKEWNGLTPLHSTRADVERILGIKSSGGLSDKVNIGAIRVFIVYYMQDQCSKNGDGWKVPAGTVFGIFIRPNPMPLPSELGIDISKLTKSGTDYGATEHTDEAEGFAISMVEGRITHLSYYGAAKDLVLRCSPSQPHQF